MRTLLQSARPFVAKIARELWTVSIRQWVDLEVGGGGEVSRLPYDKLPASGLPNLED